jgi:hypothetical protein
VLVRPINALARFSFLSAKPHLCHWAVLVSDMDQVTFKVGWDSKVRGELNKAWGTLFELFRDENVRHELHEFGANNEPMEDSSSCIYQQFIISGRRFVAQGLLSRGELADLLHTSSRKSILVTMAIQIIARIVLGTCWIRLRLSWPHCSKNYSGIHCRFRRDLSTFYLPRYS